MLTKKDYCDYDTCVALEELGFPIRRIKVKGTEKNVPILLYEAQKWLREKGIFVYIDAPWKADDGLGWSHFCCNKPMTKEDKEVFFATGGFYDSYEEALAEGVRASIKILQDEQKENN